MKLHTTVVFAHSQYTPPAPLVTHSPHTHAPSAHTTPRHSLSHPHLTRHTPHPVITTTTRTPSPPSSLYTAILYLTALALLLPLKEKTFLPTRITTTEMMTTRILFVVTLLQFSMNFMIVTYGACKKEINLCASVIGETKIEHAMRKSSLVHRSSQKTMADTSIEAIRTPLRSLTS